jgi:transposase
METAEIIKEKYLALEPLLDEHLRRLWAATEAQAIGWGGISAIARITGISRRAISDGLQELEQKVHPPEGYIRKPGGGRKSAVVHQPELPASLEKLIDPLTRGDPDSPLRWTCKSTRRLAEELQKQGFSVSSRVVRLLLHEMGYSLQANSKTLEGKQHPDRNAQFEHINARVEEALKNLNPVISVDTKKKEVLGNFANDGQKWSKKGSSEKVNDHDFPDPALDRAYPYGIYDMKKNTGFVNVGVDHDTAQFAVASIRAWWQTFGYQGYEKATEILITADSGGSNGYRIRLWKWELQKLADEIKVPISVCHFPPGTSKWNKVEHRLFSSISSNWRGEPLRDYETVINLISKTTTTKGLKVDCVLDSNKYPTGCKISNKELESLNLKRDIFHGDWNYTIDPHH